MPEVIPHFCTGEGCAALHGGNGKSDDVRIAEINAERDVEVARLARASERDFNDTIIEETKIEAEAEVEQAEIFAEAAVEESVVEAAVLEEVVNPEPEPVEVEIANPEPAGEFEEAAAPAEIESPPAETESKGWWAGYH